MGVGIRRVGKGLEGPEAEGGTREGGGGGGGMVHGTNGTV